MNSLRWSCSIQRVEGEELATFAAYIFIYLFIYLFILACAEEKEQQNQGISVFCERVKLITQVSVTTNDKSSAKQLLASYCQE